MNALIFGRKKKSKTPSVEDATIEAAAQKEAAPGKKASARGKSTAKSEKTASSSEPKTTCAKENGKEKKSTQKAKSNASVNTLKRDRSKAAAFFRHAAAVADARNDDYAIELYLNGLSHDPDNMDKHEALREVALRRKVRGGKPARFLDRWKGRDKSKIERMLQAEYIWSKNPLNFNAAITVMERAVEADADQEIYNLGEVAHWVGVLLLEKNEVDRPMGKEELVKLRDLFAEVGSFSQAVTACLWAMELDPNDLDMPSVLKDLQAEEAMIEGGYTEQPVEAIDFKKSVRDMDKQRALEQENQLGKTEQAMRDILARCRAAFEENPEDKVARQKLVKALLDTHDPSHEDEAISLLKEGYTRDKDYKYQVAIGDIQIRKLDRVLKEVKEKLVANKDDKDLQAQYKKAYREKIKFEMAQFTDRAKHYPTDRKWKFELARRLFILKQYDKAIPIFQQSVADARYKVQSSNYLGQCYLAKSWFNEAIETFERALKAHKDPDNRLGLEIRYHLMMALEKFAIEENNLQRAKEAQKVASEIIQTDINFKDISQCMDRLRALVKKLQSS